MSTFQKGLTTYAVLALLSYGWSASNPCAHYGSGNDKCTSVAETVFYSIYVALVWPLYWAYEVGNFARKS